MRAKLRLLVTIQEVDAGVSKVFPWRATLEVARASQLVEQCRQPPGGTQGNGQGKDSP